ncbi:hypothetical protein scyTo_0006626 [Scyliorhinus torazame]|uniref:Uncharacterized protein n=1 Tax=Scyliorhinus torazame TaxID=75743 RepID=A0A401PJ07_SCYTO|nr:hypothetical protein [Scyliorhinus torazame]
MCEWFHVARAHTAVNRSKAANLFIEKQDSQRRRRRFPWSIISALHADRKLRVRGSNLVVGSPMVAVCYLGVDTKRNPCLCAFTLKGKDSKEDGDSPI